MQTAVLDVIEDARVRAYVVWEPVLPEDSGTAASEASRLVPDRRAAHFWDASRTLSPLFTKVLGLPEGWPAWDVYLAYPAGVTWADEPPAPAFWHHQLGDLASAPRLDGARFADQLRSLLTAS